MLMTMKKTNKTKGNSASEGIAFIRSAGGIDEYVLNSNGLRVLLKEDHFAPVATVMVTYHVGSRNEALGHTGATHLLEHLMFKGSKKYNKENKKQIWNVLQTKGARLNATTWLDRTNYFETVPVQYTETAIAFEADRMRNAFIKEEDRQLEMTVVRNEFERGENNPIEAVDRDIWASAYQAHPYHHPTIGWRSDIENVSILRLKKFYDTFYWPNNATVTVIGDIDRVKILSLVKKYFGVHKRAPHEIPDVYTKEPEQQGQRRVKVSRQGQTNIVGVAHKTPEGLHEDTYALLVLAQLLGGSKGSMLYRRLIDKGLATDVDMSAHPFRDPGLFITYVFLTPGTTHQQVEDAVLREYEKIKQGHIGSSELDRAIAQLQSSILFARDGSYAIAGSLNEALAIGDWTFFTNLPQKIGAVTAKQIKEVARKYLTDDQSTIGYFVAKQRVL